ncbi:MAG: hypothetical protein KIH08_17320, partial [Candidatus Freyarchaeota archaeon]|nr:hypothetical protein [Candidatus Jordarchaeia archaeon]
MKKEMIWTKTMGPTQLSGTTDVLVGGDELTLPSAAKSILAIIPHLSSPGGNTAGQAIIAQVSLDSDDFSVKPYEVLAQPIGSSLGKSGIQPQDKAPIWPVNCPVPGGSELKIYAKGLHDHTIEPYVGVDVILGDFVAAPRFYSKLGTLTDTGVAAAEVKGSGIRITGGRALKKAYGLVVGTTVAAQKGIMGKFRLSSSDFEGGMGDLEFQAEPISGVLVTDATTASAQEDAKLKIVD